MKKKHKNNHQVGQKYEKDKTKCEHKLFEGHDGLLHCSECFSTYADGE